MEEHEEWRRRHVKGSASSLESSEVRSPVGEPETSEYCRFPDGPGQWNRLQTWGRRPDMQRD